MSTTYTVTSDPLTVDNAASTLVQVQNTGLATVRILPLGRTVAPGATVTVPGWLTVPTAVHTVGGGVTSTAVVTLTAGTPATAPGPGPFVLDPDGAGTMAVTITGGSWFSDEGLKTAITFPLTVTGLTRIYPSTPASVTISATAGGITKTAGHTITAGDGGSFVFALGLSELTAQQAADPASVTAAIAAQHATDLNTYGRFSLARYGRVIAWAGDSVTVGAGASQLLTAFVTIAPKIVGNALLSSSSTNAGVAGNASTELLARFPTILAANPDGVHVQIGVNDAATSMPLATFSANVIAMRALADAAGIPFTMGLVFPQGSARGTTIRNLINSYNLWLRLWAPRAGVPLADTFGALVDSATGYLSAANDSGDHIHPSDAGHTAIAVAIAAMFSATLKAFPWPVVTAAFGGGLVADPLMAANPGSDAFVLSHSAISLVAASNGDIPAGGWKRFTTTNGTGAPVFETIGGMHITSGFTAGDKLLLAMYLRGGTAAAMNKVEIQNQGGTVRFILFEAAPSATPGPIFQTFTMPPGDTEIYLALLGQTPATDTSTFDIGACEIFNLTTLGLASTVV